MGCAQEEVSGMWAVVIVLHSWEWLTWIVGVTRQNHEKNFAGRQVKKCYI
jgi:hypothetical protein